MKRILRSLIRMAYDAAPSFGFQFRMGAGIPGDVNRTHPCAIEPCLQSASPLLSYGTPCLVAADGTNGMRPFAAGDTAVTVLYGVGARPFPLQASSGSAYGGAAFGSATPPGAANEIDILRQGYIMVNVPVGSATAVKDGGVFVWCTATSGVHIQGGFETAANGGNTATLDVGRYGFNGPQDANGNIELVVN